MLTSECAVCVRSAQHPVDVDLADRAAVVRVRKVVPYVGAQAERHRRIVAVVKVLKFGHACIAVKIVQIWRRCSSHRSRTAGSWTLQHINDQRIYDITPLVPMLKKTLATERPTALKFAQSACTCQNSTHERFRTTVHAPCQYEAGIVGKAIYEEPPNMAAFPNRPALVTGTVPPPLL